jgi:dipeptide/tripeptide permease
VELWLLLSIISVALILIPLIKSKKDGKFTRRKAAAILVAAPILFVLSGLFLANTVVNPAESLAYQLGRALCFAASPTLMLSGIIVYIAAPREEKPATMQRLPVAQPGEKPGAPMPKWEKQARKIYGVTALLLLGLLVFTWSPLMLFVLVMLIPYIIFFIYMLRDKRSLVASLFFLLLWYVWFYLLPKFLLKQ